MASRQTLRNTQWCTGASSLPRTISPSTTPLLAFRQPQSRQYPYRPVRSLFYLPAVLQPSFWRSLVPTFLRRDRDAGGIATLQKKPRNPATFFIWMSLLIGSQAIQLITLHKGFERFTHETEQRLALLRDVVRRVKNGEDVDVEKELGTGDAQREKEWDEVMRELESEDAIFAERRRKANKRIELRRRENSRPDTKVNG